MKTFIARLSILVFSFVSLVLFAKFFSSSNMVRADVGEKVTICHATDSHSNPYVTNNPAKSGDVSGHDSHDGGIWFEGITTKWGDIIPPFDYGDGQHYPGKNWTTDGRKIYDNDCKVAEPTNTPTPTPTPISCDPEEACPESCHTDVVEVADGNCGTKSCPANAPAAESCPTECGYEGGTVPDGNCETKPCSATEECDGPTPIPSPTPSPIPEEPTSTPTPTPTPTPVVASGIAVGYDIGCDSNEFLVTADVSKNGSPVGDLVVNFTYGPVQATANTNSEGRASIHFTKAGDGKLTAEADGFDKAEIDINMPTCESNTTNAGTGGVVLGASTGPLFTPSTGQVLGASTEPLTFAETGVSHQILSILALFGAAVSFSRVLIYSKIN